ncbi:MAG: glycosyltransferase family 9 protein [Acidobacteria bacterium]|nr:glycosyltransferase family 9 protein [Acidobacteriota bacterium]
MNRKKMLIVRLSSFGDIIHSAPAVMLLKNHLTEYSFDWAVDSRFAGLVNLFSDVDLIIRFDLHSMKKGFHPKNAIQEMRRFKKDLRKNHYSTVVDFQGLIKSGYVSYLSGAREKAGFSFQAAREGAAAIFYNRRYHVDENGQNVIIKNLVLAEKIIRDLVSPDFSLDRKKDYSKYLELVKLRDFPETRKKLIKKLNLEKSSKKLAVIHLSSSNINKDLPLETQSTLVDMLFKDYGFNVILCGTEKDSKLAGDIISKTGKKCRFITTSIEELKELIGMSNLFFGPDSGPLHLSALMMKNTIGFYGPTNPERNGPIGKNARIVSVDPSCRSKVCWKKCRDNQCMKKIKIEDIKNAVDDLILS